MNEIKSPLKAIKQKCLECSNYQIGEVRNCPITDCALYPFRKGHNPYLKRNNQPITPEKYEQLLKYLEKARSINPKLSKS